MSSTLNVVLAGFGGQGLLFAGKLLAYTGLIEDRHVSWLPSYGLRCAVAPLTAASACLTSL